MTRVIFHFPNGERHEQQLDDVPREHDRLKINGIDYEIVSLSQMPFNPDGGDPVVIIEVQPAHAN